MFFSDSRVNFFRPLNGKSRELVALCIGVLYKRQYTSLADYGQSLNKQQIIDAFSDAVANSHIVVDDMDEGFFSDPRKHAAWIFSQLRECGWLDERVDAIRMTSSFGLSSVGRTFANAFVTDKGRDVRTHHRNTRNTRNALKAFCAGFDVHDLLDATEYSERIISDFSDIIAELEDRRNHLIEQVQQEDAATVAAQAFFDFLEDRFEPDLAVRLSVDSVERYRDDILGIITDVRGLDRTRRLQIERDLRALKLQGFHDHDIWYEQLLKMIEQRLRNACDIMLPAVRDALSSFTSRADAIIRQLASISDRAHSSSAELVTNYGALSAERKRVISTNLNHHFQNISINLIDAQQIKLSKPRTRDVIHCITENEVRIDREAQQDLRLRHLYDNAFTMGTTDLHTQINELFSGETMSSEAILASNPIELLALVNIVGVGSDSGAKRAEFELSYANKTTSDEYFSRRDVFTIKRRELNE